MAKLRRSRDSAFFVVDCIMLGLIIANLALILFEWLYAIDAFRAFLAEHVTWFYEFYDPVIHENFLWIDLAFISVFVIELLAQWAVAIAQRTYHRWFFYPFVHWYDVLGCIPVGSFRFLRVLRIFSMLFKMQRLEIVDLRNTFFFRSLDKYRGILVEEVSDRVVVNVLNGFQDEVRRGSPVTDQIVRDVIEPRREELIEALARRIQKATRRAHTHYRADLRAYLERRVADAVDRNAEIAALEQIPMLGPQVGMLLERAISDITISVVSGILADAASERNAVVQEVAAISADTLLMADGHLDLNQVVREVLLEAVELIKEQVKIQQWKVIEKRHQEERAMAGELVREVERRPEPVVDQRLSDRDPDDGDGRV